MSWDCTAACFRGIGNCYSLCNYYRDDIKRRFNFAKEKRVPHIWTGLFRRPDYERRLPVSRLWIFSVLRTRFVFEACKYVWKWYWVYFAKCELLERLCIIGSWILENTKAAGDKLRLKYLDRYRGATVKKVLRFLQSS